MSPNLAFCAVFLHLVILVHGNFFIRQDGDFIICQILPLHKLASNGSQCGQLDLERIIELEALIYSVNKIKTKKFRIGYDVIDACAESQMDSAMQTWFENSRNTSRRPDAIITNLNKQSEFFSVVMNVKLLSHEVNKNLPLISLKSRPNIWSKTYNMDPGYSMTHEAIVHLVKHFHWNTLDTLVYKDYDKFQDFKKISERNGVCLRDELFVWDKGTFDSNEWIQKARGNVSVAVVFASRSTSEAAWLINELALHDDSPRDFLLGSEVLEYEDRWNASLTGTLGIRRDSGNLKDFEMYLRASALVDEWFNDTFCRNESCDYSKKKNKMIKQLSWHGSPVIDAVYVIAEAAKTGLNKMSKTGLSGIRVTSATGRLVSFDQDKNLDKINYDVLNFQGGRDGIKAVKVGNIFVSKATSISVKKTNIVWKTSGEPRSRCSADCPPGTRRDPWREDWSAKCCWDCVRCPLGMVSSYVNSTRCLQCPTVSKPTADQTKCQPPYVDYLKWHDLFSLVMIFLLAFTVFFLVYTVNLYVKKANTPVFQKSKCASLPLLLSLFVTFVLAVLLLMKPTESSCGAYTAIFMFATGIPLTFLIGRSHILYNYCYSAAGELRRKWGHFNPQTVVSLVLIMIQLICVVIFLNIFPPKVLVFHINGTDVDYIECSAHSQPEFLPYVFVVVALVLVFNLLHMSEINTTETQNEVKYVSLCIYLMYNIFFIYFVAVYAVNGKKKIRIMCAMAYLFGLNFLVPIFFPKIYLILFQPERNRPDAYPLLGNEDDNGNSDRLPKSDTDGSPIPDLSSDMFQRTEV